MTSGIFPQLKKLFSQSLCRIVCCSLLFVATNSYASKQSAPVKKNPRLTENVSLLRYPMVQRYRVSSAFNPNRLHPVTRKRAPHQGIDFSMPTGSTIISAGAGEVVTAKFSPTAGNYVVIRHKNGYSTKYMHLSKMLVKPGQKVKQGQKIALSGNTGRSTGPHLHYELRYNNKAIDPMTKQLALVDNSRFFGPNHDRQLARLNNEKKPVHTALFTPLVDFSELTTAYVPQDFFPKTEFKADLFGDNQVRYAQRVDRSVN